MSIRIIAGQSAQTIDAISSQGFQFPTVFTGSVPQMPEDVTDLDDYALMNLYQHHNAYLQFIMAQVTCAQIDEADSKKRLEMAEAIAMEQYNGTKMTVSAIKALVAMDKDVVFLSESYTAAHNYRKGMELMYNNVKMDCDFISRELTRRTSSSFNRSGKFTV